MKPGTILAAAILLCALPARAQTVGHAQPHAAPPDAQSRQAMDAVVGQIARNPFLGLSPADVSAIQSSIDIQALQRQIEAAAAQTYTPAERAALTKFYDGPAGQAIMRKAPEFIAKVMPAMQAAAMQGVAAYMAQKQISAMSGPTSTGQTQPAVERGAAKAFRQ